MLLGVVVLPGKALTGGETPTLAFQDPDHEPEPMDLDPKASQDLGIPHLYKNRNERYYRELDREDEKFEQERERELHRDRSGRQTRQQRGQWRLNKQNRTRTDPYSKIQGTIR